MKNFEMKYPVEGASALQPRLDATPVRRARIIAFPEHAAQAKYENHAARNDMSILSAVRAGTVQGISYGRMQRWQAIVGGCVFATLAFVSLLAGM